MHARFTTIDETFYLEKIYLTHDRIRNILRRVPNSWKPTVNIITEIKYDNVITIDWLIG